jgi:hypothetical protein
MGKEPKSDEGSDSDESYYKIKPGYHVYKDSRQVKGDYKECTRYNLVSDYLYYNRTQQPRKA